MHNLSYFLSRTARLRPTKDAVFHGERMHDYRYLNERVSRLAGALLGSGLKRGDRVGIVSDCEPRGLESLFGPLRAGLALVPMNPRLHPAEHAYMLSDCQARALICGDAYLEGFMAVRSQLPQDLQILAFDGGGRVGAGID